MRSRWLGFLVAAVTLGVSVWAYPRLPASVVTHWNIRGEADGHSSRLVAAGLVPLIILGIRLIAGLLPRIDPKNPNYENFIDTYWLLVNTVFLFVAATHVLVMANALGASVNVAQLVPVGVGLLFIFIGNYLGRVQPNWFMGIRTPWTLSSDRVWRQTHRTGRWLFVLSGFLMIVTAFVPAAAVVGVLGVIIAIVAVVPVVQSYVLWKKEQRGSP